MPGRATAAGGSVEVSILSFCSSLFDLHYSQLKPVHCRKPEVSSKAWKPRSGSCPHQSGVESMLMPPAVSSEVPVRILLVQEEKMQFALSPQPPQGWHVISLLRFVPFQNVSLFQHSNGLVHSGRL